MQGRGAGGAGGPVPSRGEYPTVGRHDHIGARPAHGGLLRAGLRRRGRRLGPVLRLLLDTCTFIWLTQEPDRLGPRARALLDDLSNELLLSHVSVWEIYNKSQAGKLALPDVPRRWVEEQRVARGVTPWPIDLPSLGRMSELPLHHRDPFDRLLVAQALVHGFTLLSPDSAFAPYGVRVAW